MAIVRTLTNGLSKKYKLYTFLSPIVMIGEVIMETAIPYVMSKIIDVGIANHDLHYVIKTGTLMLACAFASLMFGVLAGRFAALASQGFSSNLRKNIFQKIQTFSFSNIDSFSTASLITRLTTDVTNAQNVYQMIIRMCVRSPFMLISGTIMACMINLRLASIFLFSVPILAIAIIIISSVAHPRFQKMLTKYDALNNTVQENLIAIRVVKAFVREDFENEKFQKDAEAVLKTQLHAEKIVVLLSPIMQLTLYCSIIASLWFGGNMIVQGNMKSGELISFLTYITQILMSLMMLGMIFVMIVISRASVKRILEVLQTSSDITTPENCVQDVKDGSIQFENVSFSYYKNQENYALQDINLFVPSGKTVGIIGGTGSSKTTLVSLLPRLYDASKGTVKIGGQDVRSYNLHALRENVSVVLQKNVLFSGTIRENMLWGKKDASDAEIINACKAAQAHDFIMSFTDGYDTELGQGGVNLSGGQKQRLCIARAILKNPKILILDDSTSACDTATESKIQEALKAYAKNTTTIIIAQRISSVQNADIIFVLDDGKINGSGTHEELLQNNAIYKEVYESQSASDDSQNDSDDAQNDGGAK